jgi:two-component system, NtrC family, response regulator AtoC
MNGTVEVSEGMSFLGVPAIMRSPTMLELMERIPRIAQSGAAVLVTGESGVGKEIVSRAIHHHSLRCSQPWVDVNCGALPEHLVESELFGYEKGAFSGADVAKKGLFELADQGTLFLDEVGELDARMQVKLLRVLDGAPYYKLGGTKKTSVNVRIITATNQDLEEAIGLGRFRADLFHRLCEVKVQVPPLRERREDILPLAEFFLTQHGCSLRFSKDAAAALLAHSWTGNVRELRNVVIRAAIFAVDGCIEVKDLPEGFLNGRPMQSSSEEGSTLEEVERRMILQALDRMGGQHAKAAESLGISRRTLSRKLKNYASRGSQPMSAAC